MKKEELRVFQGLVNYGTQAGMLTIGLRNSGVKATSYVWEDSSERIVDYILSKKLSKSRIIRWPQLLCFFVKCLLNYNIFHFYFGKSLLPHNIDIPIYHLFGKKVVMEYLGTDVDLWLGYNGVDWRNRPINRVELVKKIKRQSQMVDRQLVCSPHLYQFVDNSVILPLALDLKKYSYTPKSNHGELTFMHCPTNRIAKKTKEIEDALKRLKEEGYSFNYKCVENVTHDQLKEEYKTADVVIDQLNPWYGTVSVEAMAIGRPVVSGYYPHYLLYDNRCESLPIINANVKTIYSILKDILDGKYDLNEISVESRAFVERYHSLDAITKQLISIYESL